MTIDPHQPASPALFFLISFFSIAYVISLTDPACAEAVGVEVEETPQGYRLMRGGQPYFIRGVGGQDRLELAAKLGANSLRTWGTKTDLTPLLDEAHRLGLTVTIGLWMGHPRHGFDYGDEQQVAAQTEKLREAVLKYKDHPALLMWGVGNEVEADSRGADDRVWKAINDLAVMTKTLDPNHPTMAVLAGVGNNKIERLLRHCPDIDVLGVNTYGGLATLPERMFAQGLDRPYVVSEFGPLGKWEVRKTDWGAPYEQNSSEKAAMYLRNYRKSIADRPSCLGSYVFKWGQKQETTDTWMSMFLSTGEPTNAVDAMAVAWTGRPPENVCPRIGGLTLNAQPRVEAGQVLTANIDVTDPDGDPLRLVWKLRSETTDSRSGGDREREPPTHWEKEAADQPQITFVAPNEAGAYRLFVYAFDDQGNAETANVPFFVDP